MRKYALEVSQHFERLGSTSSEELLVRAAELIPTCSADRDAQARVKAYSYMVLCDERWTLDGTALASRWFHRWSVTKYGLQLGSGLACVIYVVLYAIDHLSQRQFSWSVQQPFFSTALVFVLVGVAFVIGYVYGLGKRSAIIDCKCLAGWPAHSSLLECPTKPSTIFSHLSAKETPDGVFRKRPVSIRFFSGCVKYLSDNFRGVEDSVSFSVGMALDTCKSLRVYRGGNAWLCAKNVGYWKRIPHGSTLLVGVVVESADPVDQWDDWWRKKGLIALAEIFSSCMVDAVAVVDGELIAYSETYATTTARREITGRLLELMNCVADSLEGELMPAEENLANA